MSGASPTEEDLKETSERSLLNESAIREHALRCSKLYRAGKFTRVGSDFMTEVYADVDAMLLHLRGQYNTLHPALAQGNNLPGKIDADPEVAFVKGYLLEKLDSELNRWLARLIQNKVQRQPSVGVTLSRTR